MAPAKYLNSYFRPVIAFCGCGYAFSLNYIIAVVVPFVVLPLVVVFVSHTLILREIRRSGTQRRRRLLKGMKTVALTVGAYYICWIPFSVNSVVESLFPQSESASSDIPIIVAVYFVISNSAMNFLVYIHSIEQFREQFKGLFCIRNRRRVHCNVPDRTKSSDGRTKGAKITTVQPCDTRITKLWCNLQRNHYECITECGVSWRGLDYPSLNWWQHWKMNKKWMNPNL